MRSKTMMSRRELCVNVVFRVVVFFPIHDDGRQRMLDQTENKINEIFMSEKNFPYKKINLQIYRTS